MVSVIIAQPCDTVKDMGLLAQRVAQGLGYAIGLGSLALYSPLLYRIWRKRSCEGLSVTVWVLKSCSYSVSAAYSHAHAYSRHTLHHRSPFTPHIKHRSRLFQNGAKTS